MRLLLKMLGPFAGGMENADQLHNLAAYSIGDNIRRSRDHQLARAGYPTGPTESRKIIQSIDCFCDRSHGPGSGIGIILGYVIRHGDQVRACRSQPFNAHVASDA